MFQLSDGRILDAGPDVTTRVMNPGTWTWSTVATSPFDGGERGDVPARQDHEVRLVREPRLLRHGTYNAVARTAVIDMSQPNPTLARDRTDELSRAHTTT